MTRGIDIRRLEINGKEIDLASSAITGLKSTVVRVKLGRPFGPGERAIIRAAWDYEVPPDEQHQALRQGRWGNDVFQIAQWYPRLAMFDDLGGWDLTEHDGSREFFNSFGRFRVVLHVPSGWLVGATGTLKNPEVVLGPRALRRLQSALESDRTVLVVEPDERANRALPHTSGNQAWLFEADSVSDFAWGASSEFAWAVTSRTGPSGRYLIHALMTPRHHDQLLAASVSAADAIAALSDRLAPYPWKSHTLLDGPEGGMEYPTLTMSNGGVIEHELAHQWFPMMVGSDETRFDFLDEGFANFFSSIIQGGPIARNSTEPATVGPLLTGTDVRTPRFVIGYGRGSRMLHALAARVGEDRLMAAMRSYALTWRFKHPSPWDFMAGMEAFLGEDLDAFWLQWLFSQAEIQPSR